MTEQLNLPNSYVNPKKGVTTVEEYEFEPIKGYQILKWNGKRPYTSTQYYPAQLREEYGEAINGWRNKIYWGDNLQVMSHLLKGYRGKIQLIYIDPPFDSKADYKKKIKLRGNAISNDYNSFEEKQYTDIWSNDEYFQFIYERLMLVKELLSPNGTLYVHTNATKGHYIKCILDEIYGESFFRNEIVWYYENKLGTGGSTLDGRHDTIFVYTKSKDWIHNPIMIPVKESKLQPVTQKVDGKRIWLRNDEGKRLYQESRPERPLGDVWEIPIINPVASERLGYPTQKPERLLENIIKLSSNPGDIVLDCFMGSGTTQAVAMRFGRRFIGADINLGAIQISTKRLLSLSKKINDRLVQKEINEVLDGELTYYTGFEVCNVNYYDVFRNPIEAKDLLKEVMELQLIENGHLFDGEKDGRLYKIMPINRIATRTDLSEIIAGLDYKAFDRRQAQNPGKLVEKITLVCMGHEPDLAAYLKNEVLPYSIDVEVVDILRDKQDLQFKRDSEVRISVKDGKVAIEAFYPMNLLQKLSLQQENVTDWRELVESIMIDWNYDGAVLQPAILDIPEGNDLVKGTYPIPNDSGTIRVKITDLLSESLEVEVQNG